jgi:hypothetical protein
VVVVVVVVMEVEVEEVEVGVGEELLEVVEEEEDQDVDVEALQEIPLPELLLRHTPVAVALLEQDMSVNLQLHLQLEHRCLPDQGSNLLNFLPFHLILCSPLLKQFALLLNHNSNSNNPFPLPRFRCRLRLRSYPVPELLNLWKSLLYLPFCAVV